MIQKKYASYVDCVCTIIENKGVTAKKLSAFLLTLPASTSISDDQKFKKMSDLKDDLKGAQTVADVFFILNSKYASFLDYEIFEDMLENYGCNETNEKLKYPVHLKGYLEKHKIEEFVRINPKLEKLNETSKKINIKFGIKKTCSLDSLKRLKEAIANILELKASTLRLLSIKKGCVQVTLLIPSSIADAIFTRDTVFTSEKEREFRAASVLWLECNSCKFDFTKQKEMGLVHSSSPSKYIWLGT